MVPFSLGFSHDKYCKMTQNPDEVVRIDRWLWAIRMFKTRQQAASAIKGGKVSLNGERPKPSKGVRLGDTVEVRKEAFRYELKVLKLGEKRVAAPIAQSMYQESEKSIADREDKAVHMKAMNAMYGRTEGRPTKRDRRILDRFRRSEEE